MKQPECHCAQVSRTFQREPYIVYVKINRLIRYPGQKHKHVCRELPCAPGIMERPHVVSKCVSVAESVLLDDVLTESMDF